MTPYRLRRVTRTGAILAASILVALALLIAGCGGDEGGDDGGGDSAAREEIVIGVDASMSGPLAGFGAFQKWAIETAVADQNANGGISVDGKQVNVKVVLRDDKSDANVASTNVDTLINKEGAVAILGPVTPAVGNPAALAAEKNGIPYLETGNPIEPFLAVKEWKYAFNFFVSGAELGDSNFKVMTDLGLKEKTNGIVATCVDNSPDGPVFDAIWTAAAKKYGWKQVKMPVYPSTATEFSSLIAKIKESKADYVVALGDTPQLVALRKQMDAANLKPPLLDFARGAQLQQFADALGPLSDGVMIESYWLPELPYPGAAEVGQRFVDDTGQSTGQILGLEYAAAQILMDAIDRADSTDPQAIVDAIAETDSEFVCGAVKFNEQNVSVIPVIWTQWQDEKSVIMWPDDVANGEPIFPLP